MVRRIRTRCNGSSDVTNRGLTRRRRPGQSQTRERWAQAGARAAKEAPCWSEERGAPDAQRGRDVCASTPHLQQLLLHVRVPRNDADDGVPLLLPGRRAVGPHHACSLGRQRENAGPLIHGMAPKEGLVARARAALKPLPPSTAPPRSVLQSRPLPRLLAQGENTNMLGGASQIVSRVRMKCNGN